MKGQTREEEAGEGTLICTLVDATDTHPCDWWTLKLENLLSFAGLKRVTEVPVLLTELTTPTKSFSSIFLEKSCSSAY